MEFGLDIAQQRIPFDEVVHRARLAEECAFTGAWGFDHFVPMYGEGPGETFEGMTTLAALAMATSRIRLGLLVAGVTYRHPSLMAAQCLTIDHASHGRLDIALGAAWFEDEHHRLDFDFPRPGRRFDLLEDQIEMMTRLFTGETVSYAGKVHSLREARMNPMPVQRPRPPIWIGGNGPKRAIPLAARYADVWHTRVETLERYGDLFDRCAAEAGRDPASIVRAGRISLVPDLGEIRREIEAQAARGFGYVVAGWPGEGEELVRRFADEVMPEYV